MHLVLTRAARDECKNVKGKKLSIRVDGGRGIANAMNTSPRVNSGEYLQGLHVQ